MALSANNSAHFPTAPKMQPSTLQSLPPFDRAKKRPTFWHFTPLAFFCSAARQKLHDNRLSPFARPVRLLRWTSRDLSFGGGDSYVIRPKSIHLWFRCGLVAACAVAASSGRAVCRAEGKARAVDFAREVAPIFQVHCVRCHQPGIRKGELSLATVADLKANEHVVPGKPAESHLLEMVIPAAEGERPAMPKEGKPLAADQVAVLRRWIAEGAVWPKEIVVREKSKADAGWWSLQPLADVEPPSPPGLPPEWSPNPIDRFVMAQLAEHKLPPNPPADRRTLIRRVTYDLTGLPPTAAELEAFVNDTSEDAYAKLVERLLASPHYGEQWGRHWLDVVRFGESNGYERNVLINNAWPFRDYIIRSFNEDKPFDRLVLEHLAGDVIGADDPHVEIGTGFLVCGPYDNVGNQDAVQAAIIRANHADEIIRATSEAFLGLTIGCARCHDHKFDPLLQKDYYSLYATFFGVRHDSRPIATKEEREAAERDGREQKDGKQPTLPTAFAGRFEEIADRPFQVLIGGDPQKVGEEVTPASLDALTTLGSSYRLPNTAKEGDRRLALARWIVAADNPLTPRVLANRLWHYHFGMGIVDTPSDFGYMGGRPTHPELLDWLARQVQEQGWRLKPLHRLIVTSQTYRQASTWRKDAADVDGNSRLLWRYPPRRLTGEELRDTMLALAGKLPADEKGGPGFRLYKYIEDNVATYVPLDEHGPETYRRAVYHQNARAAQVDVLSQFDCPDPAMAAPRRATTTTPLQALALMNHRFTLDMARFFAERVEKAANQDENSAVHKRRAEITRAFIEALGREPDAKELGAATKLVEGHGLRTLCHALLNSNELIYIR
jgi:mono/diheme cytochrome c family protein